MGEVLRSSRPFVTSARLAIAPRTIDEMRALRDVEQDPEMRQAYSEMVAAMEPLGDADYWACDWLISRADGASVGGIGFKGAPDIRGCVEVGYGIDEAFQRRGYATEATRAMVEWALVQPGVRSVVAQAEPQNAISQKVLLASGFVRDGMGEEGPLFRRLSCTSEDSAGTLAIRDIRADELSLLEDFLYEAIFIPEEITPPQCSVIREPLLWRTIDGFGTLPDDRCLVAEGRRPGGGCRLVPNDRSVRTRRQRDAVFLHRALSRVQGTWHRYRPYARHARPSHGGGLCSRVAFRAEGKLRQAHVRVAGL